MVRGTTAQFKFQLPYDFQDLKVVQITFWQPGNNGPNKTRPLPIIKHLSQCMASKTPNELCVTLTQEETLRFSEKSKAYVQLRATSLDGNSFASKQEILTIYPVYDDSILDDGEIVPDPSDDGWSYIDGGTV